jgi:hypothetical protein
MDRIPNFPTGKSFLPFLNVIIQNPVFTTNNKSARGNVMALKSLCRKSSQFLAKNNLRLNIEIPLSSVNYEVSMINNSAIFNIFQCYFHEIFKGRIVPMVIKFKRVKIGLYGL